MGTFGSATLPPWPAGAAGPGSWEVMSMADAARVREALRLHAQEGEAFASELAALSEAEWETPSTCPPWTGRLLAAHVARQVASYINSVEQGLSGEGGVPEPRDRGGGGKDEVAARRP